MRLSPIKWIFFLILMIVMLGVGWRVGSNSQVEKRAQADQAAYEMALKLDMDFFAALPAHGPSLASGQYILETRLPGKDIETVEFPLDLSDEKTISTSMNDQHVLPIQHAQMSGNVITFTRINYDEYPSMKYIGIIDGDTAWGCIEVGPGQGWRLSEPHQRGWWKLYPQANMEN